MRIVSCLILLLLPPCLHAGDAKKADPQPVPYRLSETHHVVVRAKINGKGPYNFVVDTGCPILLIAEPVGKKLGLAKDAKGWSMLDKLELEGGLSLKDVKARIETPFQIEGMNSMGLAGVELHGLMGYTVLAKFRMQLDFTKDRMEWTPLAFDPPPPQSLGAKGASAGMEVMVGLVKVMSFLAGNLGAPPPRPRGFCGFELTEKDGQLLVERVLAKSPAAEAGLKAGDRIEEIDGKEVRSLDEVQRRTGRLTAGRTLRLMVRRGEEQRELKIIAGAGL